MPRPIEHVLDSIYYSNLENFGDSMAEPFGSEGTDEGDDEEDINRNARRHAGESTSDDFYGGDKPDDYYDDLNDGPEGEDKHPDPFVQRMRDQKSSRRVAGGPGSGPRTEDLPEWEQPGNHWKPPTGPGTPAHPDSELPEWEQQGNHWKPPTGSGTPAHPDSELPPWERQNKGSTVHTAPGGGQHAPYRINEDGGGYKVVNDQGETKGTHDTKEDALDQQAALYVNVPGAKEEAESKGKSSRRKLADGNDSKSGGGPTFTAPDSMRGSWSCSDCPADDLGVHDLNAHAEAHRQTTHRASMANEILFL